MKLAFIYDSNFNILSPFQRPVTDAEAAVSFLAIELAKIGHDVTVFSDTSNHISAFNVRCRKIHLRDKALHIDKAILQSDYDAIIVKNTTPEFLVSLHHALPHRSPIYLWTDFDKEDTHNSGLHNESAVREISGIICISEWQRERILSITKIPHNKITTLQYAISPFFENLFVDAKEFLHDKPKVPALACIDDDFEDMQLLLNTYADAHKNYPDATLTIYSGMHKYGREEDLIEKNYEIPKGVSGIDQIGSISKTNLAAALRAKTILIYPATKAKTYNTQVLEAMAAGVYVVTSNVGALSEYGHHLSKNVPYDELETDDLNGFHSQVLTICQTQAHSAKAFYDYCFKQQLEVNEKYTWRVKARELIALLTAKS